MPYQVQQIIQGKGSPLCVTKDDSVSNALALMIENDYSQLPVVKKENSYDVPEGLITYEGILRGIRNFNAKIEDLKVLDVMGSPPIYSCEDDLFDILDRLKETNAVLVMDGQFLVGIVTSYDTTEYFRNRTEDMMRVEDIELMVKEFIKVAYMDATGETDETKLSRAIERITAHRTAAKKGNKPLAFDELSLSDYISLLLYKETWNVFEPIFGVQRGAIDGLLNGVRKIRNALAHFQGDITAEQRDKLKFCTEWLSKRQEEYQTVIEEQHRNLTRESGDGSEATFFIKVEEVAIGPDFVITEATKGGGRYAALADWLQSQPGRTDRIQLTFNKIEEIIDGYLPPSAKSHRAWWANDSVGHTQSRLWLEAGWRTTSINMSEGKITFGRIREREKAYITFFSKLLDMLRKKADFPIRDVSPDGVSWIVIQSIPRSRASVGSFAFSFSRDKRLRVELYLDLGEKAPTKAAFAKLFSQKEHLEAALGPIEWERLDNRRASRLALYHEGHIADDRGHSELRTWATETMIKFYNTLLEPAEKAIFEAQNG